MRIRNALFLFIPLIAILATGCTEQSPAPAAPPANSPAAVSDTPATGTAKAVRRAPRNAKSLSTGPEGVSP